MNSTVALGENRATPATLSSAASAAAVSRFSRIRTHIARVLLGLLFFVTGLNVFFNFMPQPKTPLPEGAMAFAGALLATGYMMPLIASTQLFAGALLLANRFVPLALVVLAPFLVNAALFHAFLEPSGRAMIAIVVALELYLAWTHRRAYAPLFVGKLDAGR